MQKTELKPKTDNTYITADEPAYGKSLAQEVRAHHVRLDDLDKTIEELDIENLVSKDYVDNADALLNAEIIDLRNLSNENDEQLQGEINDIYQLIGEAGEWVGDVPKAYVDNQDQFVYDSAVTYVDAAIAGIEIPEDIATTEYVDAADANLQAQIDEKQDIMEVSYNGTHTFVMRNQRNTTYGINEVYTYKLFNRDATETPSDYLEGDIRFGFTVHSSNGIVYLSQEYISNKWTDVRPPIDTPTSMVDKQYVDSVAGGGGGDATFADDVNVADVNWSDKVSEQVFNTSGGLSEIKNNGYELFFQVLNSESKSIIRMENDNITVTVDGDPYIATEDGHLLTKAFFDANTPTEPIFADGENVSDVNWADKLDVERTFTSTTSGISATIDNSNAQASGTKYTETYLGQITDISNVEGDTTAGKIGMKVGTDGSIQATLRKVSEGAGNVVGDVIDDYALTTKEYVDAAVATLRTEIASLKAELGIYSEPEKESLTDRKQELLKKLASKR